ncbi:MAG TPA: ABC transporter permease subunit [Anaerolineales bacterium]|nr:ABC transporter permease subunit [Anaerolineales bacterium]
MTNYLIRRLFQMMLVVFLSTIAIYVLLNVAPGGPLSGIRLAGAGDAKTRVSDADIARLKSYLGLDKPLALRYVTWMLGTDWLGADWMYLGIGRFVQDKTGRDGNPIVRTDRDTGEVTIQSDTYRFWVDPGTAHYNPGYQLWVVGEETGLMNVNYVIETPTGQETRVQELQSFRVDKVWVKPKPGQEMPPEVIINGVMVYQEGNLVVIENVAGVKFALQHTPQTEFFFPEFEVSSRPETGTWLNIGWLTGSDGLLGKYGGYYTDPNTNGSFGVARLDFGKSWRLSPSQPVSSLIMSRLGNTIILMSMATLISILVGIPIGIYSAIHQYSRVDYAVTTFSFFGSAMPVFWFGLMMILLFSVMFNNWGLPFLPTGGVSSVRTPQPGSLLAALGATPGSFVDRSIHLLMPTLVLSLLYLASWSRYSRSSMLEVLRQDYVRTARAKGLIERVVIIKHALRNALIPIVTILVFDIAGIFSGAILTETIFSYPGMGSLYFAALGQNDWPVVMAFLMITAILVVIATLSRDILYTIVDPRIRFS